MRIINLLYKGSRINYGVWISAISTAQILHDRYGVSSEVWFPQTDTPLLHSSVQTVQLSSTSTKVIPKLIRTHQLNPKDTVIQTHGSWRYQSRWGFIFQKLGFKWVYHPHGMLNTHGFEEKGFKKQIYWRLIERFLLKQADAVRLVTSVEQADLIAQSGESNKLWVIANGIDAINPDLTSKDVSKRTVLFMSRLFHGKGVVPLVEGWLKSQLNDHPNFELVIAGPDQGELEKINQLLNTFTTSNIKYIGPIYNQEKENWLKRSSYYILPSVSEAFSTSILEGMSYGLIPVITPNCNFPEVFAEGIGLKITTDAKGIRAGLNQLPAFRPDQISQLQKRAATFVNEHYTLDKIAAKQYDLFQSLLQSKPSTIRLNPVQRIKGHLISSLG